MKIAVCVKQIPTLSMLKFDNSKRKVIREGVPLEVNHFDLLAVCAALNLKHTFDIELSVYSMGPPQAKEALIQCLALGADRGFHLVDDLFAGSDTLATARALAYALKRDSYDIIICGRNSLDAETGQVGPEIAELLDLPQITSVRDFTINKSLDSITAERITDEGYDIVSCKLPALITVTEGVSKEQYPDKGALERASTLPLNQISATELSHDTSIFGAIGSPTWVSNIFTLDLNREQILVRDLPVDKSVRIMMDYLEKKNLLLDSGNGQNKLIKRGGRRAKNEIGSFWIVPEIMGDAIRPVSLEIKGRAIQLADHTNTNTECVLIGDNLEKHLSTLTAYGADKILVAEDFRFSQFDVDFYTEILQGLILTHNPFSLLIPSTVNGRDLASRLSARMGIGLTGDCIGLEIDEQNRLVAFKPAFGGNVVAPIISKTLPQMVTIRPGVFTKVTPDWSIKPQLQKIKYTSTRKNSRIEIIQQCPDKTILNSSLENAKIIIGVGKGIGNVHNLGIIRKLADVLNASIGSTREVADLGWLPRQTQIGLSGKSVSPDLYIAIGIRGPFNHTVGIQKAKTVIAINNSARSPIFKAADFGILGDFSEIVPELTKNLQNFTACTGVLQPNYIEGQKSDITISRLKPSS